MLNESPAKILFLDDEQPVLNALRRALRKEGFELFFTSDPDEALRLVGEKKIDVVVSDHLMPSMTGLEFFTLASRLHPRVCRIMLTGQADVDTAIRAINEGQVHKFLTKPWDDAQLKRTLHDAARESQTRRAAVDQARTAQLAALKPMHTSIRRDPTGAIVLEDAA
jgi:two-component system, probable response regulator PhcQ